MVQQGEKMMSQLDSQVPYKKVDDEFLASPEKVGHQFTTHICIYMNFMNPPFGFCKIAKTKKKREKGGRQWMVDQVPLRDAAAPPLLYICLFLSLT